MKDLEKLLDNNSAWAEKKLAEDPQFFERLAKGQKPRFLWIGCSDSRLSPTEILGLTQGDLFVHRNVANLFLHTDFNSLSVLQYAVEYLNIEYVIVCGHYGCGGVAAAMEHKQLGLLDNWLRSIRDIYLEEKDDILALPEGEARYRRLVELNVLHQVMNICHTSIVQSAWSQNKKLTVHGWVYDMSIGRLSDLGCNITSPQQIEEIYRTP